ncbi:MAG: hypothetical protein RI932_208, partial [Pseudomonadota bacterium]
SDLLDHLGAPFEAFDARGQDTNMEDLFLGYVGGLDGVAGARPTNLNFAGFSERFSLDPKAILKYK